jgi:excisionase family DNA binding protein
MENFLLTPKEVQARISIGKTRFFELVRAGVIPTVRVGRSLRVRQHDLEKWIDTLPAGR